MSYRSCATVVLRILAAVPLLMFPSLAVAQTSGLVAAYAFNETSGTTALDASGNGNNGVLTNGAQFVADTNGNRRVVSLDGVNDYVNLSNPASLRLTGSMTLSAWINSSAFPADDATLISKRQSSETGYQLDTTIDRGPRTIGLKITNGSGNNVARYGATAMVANTWYHVAGVYDATNRTLNVYLNGQLDNGALVGTIPTSQRNSNQNVNIGRRPGVPGTFNFAGVLDDVRIYNRALSQAEIQTDMNTPVGGTPPPPDTTPPTVAITAPTSGATYTTSTSPLTLSGTAADNVGVTQVSWASDRGGSGTATGTASWSVPSITLQTGTNVLTVTARDAAGNTGTATLTVTYTPAADTTPPTVAITAPTSGATYTTSTSPLTLSGTAADNVGVTQVSWASDRGGSGTATGTASWSVPSITLQTGTNVLTVTARDAAGNTGTATLTVTYTPASDTTPPTVAITAPTSGATYTTSTSPLTLSGTAADNVGVTQVSWASDRGGSGTATGTASWSVPSITLQTGTNVLTVAARDAAGNTGTATLTVTYTPASDTTPPTVAITAPGPGSTVSGTTTITATASDNIGVVGVQFLLDSAALGPEQTGPSFSLSWNTTAVSNGAHVLSARARDAANNTALAPNISVTVANTQTPGLVAAYGFNEGSGTTVLDISGNNNTGTISGATWTTLGKFGSALVFNGTSARVTINDSSSLRLTSGMTLEAWVNPSTVTSVWRDVIYKGNDNYFLEATSDHSGMPAGGGTFGGTDVVTYGTAALPVNTWTHLALTYDGATLRLYVNGAQVSSLARTGNLAASTNPLQIGGDSLFGQYFQGTIDEVRVYNRALSQAEIQTDMTTPVGGTPPPPDTTPPTVAINAPTAGATVFGLVSVSVVVSDNVGIAGVQFLRDNNVPLGTEVTFAPYSILWDTTSVSPGSHSLTAVARDFAGNSTTSAPVSVTVAAATASRVGQWSAPVTWPIVAVHASLLPTGAVLAWDGQTNGNDARLWNPTTGVFTSVPNNLTNMFCSGHCALADGQILVAGGHAGGHTGVKDTNLFDPGASKWTKVGAMGTQRWYPTTTTLPDGRVLVTAGEINCDRCEALIPELYNPQTKGWTPLSSSASLNLPYYPHMFVLPDLVGDGHVRVLAAATAEDPIITYVLDISTQTWSVIDPNPVDGGSSVMYLLGKVMKTGTSTDPDMPTFPSAATTYVLDMTEPSPAWRETAPMAFPRTYHTLTLLPDGTVLVTGGGVTTDAVGVSEAVSHAELWSPVSETWTTMASMQKPRLYHSTALLLPDGRVLAAGGGRFNGVNEPTDQLSSETFSPPYLFNKDTNQPAIRPTISSAPATTTYGGTIAVQTPDAAQITAVSLIRLGSVTHAFNQNQRFLQLLFTTGSGVLNIQAPSNANLAPPGYYMLFILNANGVPSVAVTLKLS